MGLSDARNSSARPEAIDQYPILHLVGDVVALIRELGEEQVVVVGHDRR